jgi:hypothetical protein
VDVDEEVLDSSYHHGGSRGIWFPEQEDYGLKGDPKCKPKPKRCHSALVYARSRKGTMGDEYNSDWRRAERQQDTCAAIKHVLDDEGAGIGLLHAAVRDLVETNLPKTTEAAGALLAAREDAAARDQHEGARPRPGPAAAPTAASSPTWPPSATGWTSTSTGSLPGAIGVDPGRCLTAV